MVENQILCEKKPYKNNAVFFAKKNFDCEKKFVIILLLQKLDPASCSAAIQLVVQLPSRVAQLPYRVAQLPYRVVYLSSRVVQMPSRIDCLSSRVFHLPSRVVCVPP